MEEQKEFTSKQKDTLVITLLVLVSLIGGITYAYFRVQGTSAEQTITTANLSLTFGDGTAIVNASNISPIYEDEILTKAAKKTFTVAKTSNSKDIYADIEISNITIPNELKNYDFKWALYEGSNKITTGNFATLGTDTNIILATNQLITSTTKTYNLYIWINETEQDQNTMMGKTFKGTIKVSGSDKQANTLANNILKETPKTNAVISRYSEQIATNQTVNYASSTNKKVGTGYTFNETTGEFTLTGIVDGNVSYSTSYVNYYTFDSTATTGYTMYKIKTISGTTVTSVDRYTSIYVPSTDKGLYVQKDDSTKTNFGFTTYYYRGSVTNNYVEFGSYTSDISNQVYDVYNGEVQTVVAHTGDPIKWRVVRINEDGSIRLISEHNIGDSWHVWNSSGVANYKGSEIETTVNSWYTSKTNIGNTANLNNKVIMGDYCSDIGDNYNGYKRIGTEMNPRFICSNEGTMINAKAGMITADEMIYGGTLDIQEIANNTTYLDNSTYFWTMTPYSSLVAFSWFPDMGCLSGNAVYGDSNVGARAVINLKSNITVSSGTGTSADPYIIK